MKIIVIIGIILSAIFPWLFFASLQDEEIDMLTQDELEELANALWESDDDES